MFWRTSVPSNLNVPDFEINILDNEQKHNDDTCRDELPTNFDTAISLPIADEQETNERDEYSGEGINDTIQMILKYHQSLKKTLHVFTICLQFIEATNKNSSITKSLHDLEEMYTCQHCTCEHCSSMNDICMSKEFSSITLKETNKHKY